MLTIIERVSLAGVRYAYRVRCSGCQCAYVLTDHHSKIRRPDRVCKSCAGKLRRKDKPERRTLPPPSAPGLDVLEREFIERPDQQTSWKVRCKTCQRVYVLCRSDVKGCAGCIECRGQRMREKGSCKRLGVVQTAETKRAAVLSRKRSLIAQGLCGSCGREPLVNATRCEACRAEHCEAQKMRNDARGRQPAKRAA